MKKLTEEQIEEQLLYETQRIEQEQRFEVEQGENERMFPEIKKTLKGKEEILKFFKEELNYPESTETEQWADALLRKPNKTKAGFLTKYDNGKEIPLDEEYWVLIEH